MGRCESSFDMTACQAPVQSHFQLKKKQPINVLVSVIRSPALKREKILCTLAGCTFNVQPANLRIFFAGIFPLN